MSRPIVSVIIPTYNRRRLVQSAIRSVLCQTFTDYEVIVVDDGSTDGTTERLKKQFGDRIHLLTTNNSGVSASRNKGIANSSGEFIALLDSDDIWHEKKLEKQVTYHRENKQLQISQTQEIWIRKGQRVNPMLKHQKPHGDIFHENLAMCTVSPSSVFLSRRLWNQFGGFDEDLPACEDYDLWLRMSSKVNVGIIDELLLTKFGGHADQLSRYYSAMDRFRIYSLVKLLQSGELTRQQYCAAHSVCVSKINILTEGMKKRGSITSPMIEFFEKVKTKQGLIKNWGKMGKELLLTNDVFD